MHLKYIDIIRERYRSLGYPDYRWVENQDPPPWHPLPKPLSQCRIGLVASGGIYVAGQVAFHWKDDFSFREIPRGIRTSDLRTSHFAYDQRDARSDINVVFPIDTLRTLVKEGAIRELAGHLFTFMGGIYSARRVRDKLAPKLTQRLLDEGVDALLLVPV